MTADTGYRNRRRRDYRLPPSHPDHALAEAQHQALRPYTGLDWGVILDFGAGNAPYRPLFRCRRYVAADIEQNRSGTIDLLLDADAAAIPMKSGSCDLVLCMDVLEHVADAGAVLAECLRVLRPQGVLIAAMPFLYREHETPADHRRYTADGIHHRLTKAGFEKVALQKMGNRWVTLFTIFYESSVKRGERVSSGMVRTWFFRVFNRSILPVLNRTLFLRPPGKDASTYARLLAVARKGGGNRTPSTEREPT